MRRPECSRLNLRLSSTRFKLKLFSPAAKLRSTAAKSSMEARTGRQGVRRSGTEGYCGNYYSKATMAERPAPGKYAVS
jgi:hypothetical protein